MRLAKIVFFITDDCNFNCKYCYHKKNNSYIKKETIEDTMNFFLPKLPENYTIHFSGGEPLLAFDLIKHTASLLKKKNTEFKKKVTYTLTSNGSLISEEIIRFFNDNNFSVGISFDGYAQNKTREKGSFDQMVSVIKKILKYPDIRLDTSSVFTPETINELSESMKFIILNRGNLSM